MRSPGHRPVQHGFSEYASEYAGKILFKTDTLKKINTRAGYMESSSDVPCPFVIFLNNGNTDIEVLTGCIENQIAR